MITDPISPALPLAATPQNKPTKMEDAAKQFEALLIGQMLRSVRESGAGDDADSSSSTMLDIADQQFSQLLARNGGLGLAHMIVKGLQQDSEAKDLMAHKAMR